MKDFFKNKANIFLSLVLVGVLAVILYMAYGIFGPEQLIAIDFSKLHIDEVLEWKKVHEVSDDVLVINYEYDEEIAKDYVIYQSVKANDVIDEKIEIIISKGYDPDFEVELPSLEEVKTLEEIEKWFDEHHFSDITYEYVLSNDHDKDEIIRLNHEGLVKRSTAILVYLSAGSDYDELLITVPDFSDYSKESIDAWAKTNRMNIKYNYEISSSYPQGSVIEQDVEAKSEIKVGTKITITLSSGQGVTMADLYKKTKSDAASWANQNGIYLTYVENYHNSISKGLIYQTSPKANTLIAKGSTVTIYLSKGKESDDYVTVDGDRLGVSEEEFLNYIKSLGLSATKSDVTNYSTTLKKGTIYWYDDGKVKKGTVIGYGLSEGPYVVRLDDFDGSSKSEAESLIKEANNRNAHLSLKTNTVETDAYKEGTLFDCDHSQSGKNITITCSVAKKVAEEEPDTPVTPPVTPPEEEKVMLKNYVGTTSPCNGATSCTVDGLKFSVTFENSSSVAKDIVISQSPQAGEVNKGSSVSLVVSLGEKVAYIPSVDILNTKAVDGYDAASSFIANTLKDFPNLSISGQESEYAPGQIISVSVNGVTGYTPGNYPLSAEIVVIISNKQKN